MKVMSKGLFITLEGSDGCGKSTQALAIKRAIEQEGIKAILTREPGGTALGESIREIVLSPASRGMSARTEMLLYAASRAQHVEEIIRPHLEEGTWVISDRFVDSSLVYQGLGLSLGMEEVLAINLVATRGLMPDLTIVLYLSAQKARERLLEKLCREGIEADRIESRDLAYQERVAEGYRLLAAKFPARVLLIDAEDTAESITRAIMSRIHQFERGDGQ